MEIHFDTADSQLEQDGSSVLRLRRGFMATAVEGASTDEAASLLFRVYDGLASHGVQWNAGHPSRSGYFVTRILITGQTQDTVTGQILYETFSGGVQSMLVVTSASRTNYYTTNIHPILQTPLFIDGGLDRLAAPGKASRLPGDYATMRFKLTSRVVQVQGLRLGSLDAEDDHEDKVSSVNDSPWRGRPKGHWQLDLFQTRFSKYQGYHTVLAEASTKGPKPMDWSETSILRSSLTGKLAYVNPTTLSQVMAMPYSLSTDIGYGVGPNEPKGFIRVGPYLLENFTDIFGF